MNNSFDVFIEVFKITFTLGIKFMVLTITAVFISSLTIKYYSNLRNNR